MSEADAAAAAAAPPAEQERLLDTEPPAPGEPEPELEPEPEQQPQPQPEPEAQAPGSRASLRAAEFAEALPEPEGAAMSGAEALAAQEAAADEEVRRHSSGVAAPLPAAIVVPGDAAPLRNANGCEEPHSKRPELWNIDGTELDMKGSYKVGGQMWYLQDRANDAVKDGRPIAGFPINDRAKKTGHLYKEPEEEEEDDYDGNEPAAAAVLGQANGAGAEAPDGADPYATTMNQGTNLYTMMMEAVAKKKEEDLADDYLFAKRALFCCSAQETPRLSAVSAECAVVPVSSLPCCAAAAAPDCANGCRTGPISGTTRA